MSPDFSKYETACMLPDLQKKKKKKFFHISWKTTRDRHFYEQKILA